MPSNKIHILKYLHIYSEHTIIQAYRNCKPFVTFLCSPLRCTSQINMELLLCSIRTKHSIQYRIDWWCILHIPTYIIPSTYVFKYNFNSQIASVELWGRVRNTCTSMVDSVHCTSSSAPTIAKSYAMALLKFSQSWGLITVNIKAETSTHRCNVICLSLWCVLNKEMNYPIKLMNHCKIRGRNHHVAIKWLSMMSQWAVDCWRNSIINPTSAYYGEVLTNNIYRYEYVSIWFGIGLSAFIVDPLTVEWRAVSLPNIY